MRHRERLPNRGPAIVAANHNSHLDTVALLSLFPLEDIPHVRPVAAADYFMKPGFMRWFSLNVIGIIPVARGGVAAGIDPLEECYRALERGEILLIFPEGTRSETGVMADFKPSLGYLAMQNKCGILPMYLHRTHDAMPKGRYLPKRGERVAAYVGPYLPYEQILKLAGERTRSAQYRAITHDVEATIRRLAPHEAAWTLGEAGTTPMAEWLESQGRGEDTANTDEETHA